MSDAREKLNRLETRLEKMVEYQDYFYREINQLRAEIKSLKQSFAAPEIKTEAARVPIEEIAQAAPVEEKVFSKPPLTKNLEQESDEKPARYQSPVFAQSEVQFAVRPKSNLEEFIGRNLISLIGIIITILGVGIGAKYAIDRDLISPLARIVLGYSFAAALFAVALWLKNKYLNFSAVLLSGSLAMMYFLTYFAYAFYALVPQKPAFLMMLVFTALTVVAAVRYDRQVIAHIGLVGAYAMPFLLSENSGRADVLFGYMTIINFGILAISVRKFWKPLYYSSFVFTWLIYSLWFLSSYRQENDFAVAFGFALIFFLTFYLTFLSYKLIAKEAFNAEIVVLVLLNSFIFYGFGYAILDSRENFAALLGLFTLSNALLNFVFAVAIHKYKLGDYQNFYLAVALAVTFATIAVPVQLSGNPVTLIWTAEAAILFWIGRARQIALYESLSYPLMFLAAVSLLNDWQIAFGSEAILTPVFNQNFLTAILFAAAFGFITFLNRDERYRNFAEDVARIIDFIAPAIFLFALYNAFRIEIGNYFHAQIMNSAVEIVPRGEFNDPVYRKDQNLQFFNAVWQINYSMLFLTALSFVNIRKVKSASLGFINLGLNGLMLFVFLTVGLYLMSDLRADYLTPDSTRGAFHILIRYVSYAFVAALIYAVYEYVKQEFLRTAISKSVLDFVFDLTFYFSLLWIASSELLNWMDISGYQDSHKLGLSILWGVYLLLLIGLGIFKRKLHLRVGAIALFALTLIKLFFYDIADLDTISKTVVFVVLGVLLLIISFLYNKYKDLIFEKSEES